jgi:hypothetical protein
MQWRPETKSVAFLNVFDLLSKAGKDDWLLQNRQIPRPKVWAETNVPWDQIRDNRLSTLKNYPALAASYYGVEGDPVEINGLPVAEVTKLGEALVLRAQRVVLQEWTADTPWAHRGQVTVALGGDIAKETGLLPKAALVPMTSTTQDLGNLTAGSPLPPVPAVQDDLAITKRVFVVYAFINAGGYDDDNNRGFSATRQRVREAVAATDKSLLDRVRAHYQQRPHVLFATYGAYAISLQGTGPFTESELTPHTLEGTVSLLNEFYTKAQIGSLWEANQGDYYAVLHDILPLLAGPAQEMFDYSREPGLTTSAYVYIPNLLEAFGRASTSQPDQKRYIIQGQSVSPSLVLSTFRHEVAHSVVKGAIEDHLDVLQAKKPAFARASAEVTRFYRTWPTFVEECLVRAMTARVADIVSPGTGAGEALTNADTDRGFFLVAPFVEQMKIYESTGQPLRQFARYMFEAIQ